MCIGLLLACPATCVVLTRVCFWHLSPRPAEYHAGDALTCLCECSHGAVGGNLLCCIGVESKGITWVPLACVTWCRDP